MLTEESLLKELFANLNEENIKYVVLRGYKDLPNIIHNDVDFFIHPNSVRHFTGILFNIVNELHCKLEIELVRQGVFKCLIIGNGIRINLDFWYNLTFLGFSYLDSQVMMSRRKMFNEKFYIPDSGDEFQVSFLKEILHNQKVRDDKVLELCVLVDKISDVEGLVIDEAFRNRIKSELLNGSGKKYYLSMLSCLNVFSWNIRTVGILSTFSSIISFFKIKYSKVQQKKLLEVYFGKNDCKVNE